VKKLLLIAPFFLLAGCMGAGDPGLGLAVPPAMPDLPQQLAKKAEPLPPLTGTTLADREKELSSTEQAYNEKGTQLNALIDAWNCVKVSLKNRTDPSKCL
jgi:hypothetical protein